MRRQATCLMICAGLAFGLVVSADMSLLINSAQAQQAAASEAESRQKRKPRSRKSKVLGKAAFQKIEQSQKLLEEEKFDEAMGPLEAVLQGTKFKPYEKAVAIQTIGFVHAAKGDYPATILAFERAIATGDLPPRVVSDLTYNLARLYLAEDRAEKSLQLWQNWFDGLEKPPRAEAFAMKAQAHVMLAQWRPGEQAIKKALSKTDTPKQNWTRILLAILLSEARYAEAKPVLQEAVLLWPEVKAFWQQLNAVAYETDDEQLAFVCQQAMHVQNMLETSRELSTMAQLYLYHNVPIKAAKLLAEGMAADKIDKTEENYALLAQAYMHAREWQKAVKPLTRAAALSDDGKHYQQLAQSYVQNENWKSAEAALEKALAKGGLDKPADSWLLLGIARSRQEKYDDAISAFRKAGDDDDIAKDAFRWIRAIERRLAAARG